MPRPWVVAGFVSLMIVANLTGCGSNSPSPARSQPPSTVVFAAASLKPAFTRIAERMRVDRPDDPSAPRFDFDFAGSSELATQLTQGATADVFASADTAQMDTVVKAGLLAGNPVKFASNTLVIVTAPGNPKHVESFADLTKPGLIVVVCQQPVPCGAATQRIEDKTGIHLNPVSEEPNVTDVLNKVTSGQADAGLVYVTDAVSAGDQVIMVKFPEAAGAVNVYTIAVPKKAPQPGLAQNFVDMVTSERGQKILHQCGFEKP